MQQIDVYDSSGDNLSSLVQWDKDVNIFIQHPDIAKNYNVHFFNSCSDKALVVESSYHSGKLNVKVPNVLLTQPLAIVGYVYVTEDNESKSLYGFQLTVRKRPQPSNYVYTGTNDYVSLEDILQECKGFSDDAQKKLDTITQHMKTISDFSDNMYAATDAANTAASNAYTAASNCQMATNAATNAANGAVSAANQATTAAEKVNIKAEELEHGIEVTVTDRTGTDKTVHLELKIATEAEFRELLTESFSG